MLKSLDKLYLLKKADIHMTEDLILYWEKNPKDFNLNLKTLSVSFGQIIYGNQKLKIGAASLITQLLESSKDVIQKLEFEPVGFLGIVFPTLEKLYYLGLWGGKSKENIIIFHPEFQMSDQFPNLQELGKIIY